MRTVLIHTSAMDAVTSPKGVLCAPGFVSLAALPPGTKGSVVSVGSSAAPLSALERRLLEFGFVHGEQVEILAEARPGRDPFVVRIGHTTLALRRREAQTVWVELHHPGSDASPHTQVDAAADRVELHHPGSGVSPHAQVDAAAERVELHHANGSGPGP
jgi:ferrous iron transport protein A